ncbi:hypothetical protein ACS0TY_030087 [Phlomoides rotata]
MGVVLMRKSKTGEESCRYTGGLFTESQAKAWHINEKELCAVWKLIRDSGQNILLLMYLVNIRNFGHSKEQTPFMLIDGTSLEPSPQSVPLHQDFEKFQNYHIEFLMSSTSLGIITLILKEVKNWK